MSRNFARFPPIKVLPLDSVSLIVWILVTKWSVFSIGWRRISMNTLIIAHRGYSGAYPENTMLAFKQAVSYQADGIELDIQLTKDQEIVICHDEKIDRTSNGKGWLKDFTLEELRCFFFNNQMNYQADQIADLRIPTLDEFLAWFSKQSILVNIEFKTGIIDYPGIVAKTIKLVRQYGVEERVIFSSFNHYTVMEAKHLAPDIRAGFLTSEQLYQPGNYCAHHQIDYYHPHYLTLEDQGISDCKKHGIGINTYTVNEPAVMKRLLMSDIHSIITNEVELAVQEKMSIS